MLPIGLNSVGAAALAVAGLPTRAFEIVIGIEALLPRVSALVERIELTEARADALVTDVAAVTERAASVAEAAGFVANAAGNVAHRADQVAADAGETARAAREVVTGARSLVASYEQPLTALEPAVRRFAETFSTAEVDALVAIVDRLPSMLESVDADVLPLLHKLDDIAPDLHNLLETVQDLQRAISGLPGIRFLKRRGDDELADEGVS